MYMLPNEHHPGPRCSCEYCWRKYPDEMLAQLETDGALGNLVEEIRARRLAEGLNPDTGLPDQPTGEQP